MSKAKIAVLISGSGSNLQAIINACQSGELDAEICLVLSNKADAYGLLRAHQAGIETLVIDHRNFAGRESFDRELIRQLDQYQPDILVLAGFMRILSTTFVEHYLGRLINIHPSLLPRYPGLHTHQRVIDAGDAEHGASVHFVIPELDAGPVIIQGKLQTRTGETADELAARVLKLEHRIYPKAVEWLTTGRAQYRDGKAWLDGEPLAATGYQLEDASV